MGLLTLLNAAKTKHLSRDPGINSLLSYANLVCYFVGCLVGRRYRKHCHKHRVKLIYCSRIVGRKQVTARFLNCRNFAKSQSYKVIRNYTDE